MVPFPKGLIRPRSVKNRAKISLGVWQTPPSGGLARRPPKSLLDPPPAVAPLHKGVPQLDAQFDTLNARMTGFRKYKPPPGTTPPPPRVSFALENFGDLKAAFRFEALGRFDDNGDVLRDEMLKVARDLFLVGWVKCRSRFAVGHLQGDSYALSYFRRWLEMHSQQQVAAVRVTEENFGIAKFDYEKVAAVEDFRSPAKKKLHVMLASEKQKAAMLLRESQRRAADYRRFYDEHCIRNY